MQQKKNGSISWYALALMAFSSVWSFGNVVNGFSEFEGLRAIFSWVLVFLLYFIPYALMVGELGSAFPKAGGGVSSWISETVNPKMAYYAGWTYWVVHLPYISQKPGAFLIATSWALFQDNRASSMPPILLQGLALLVFCVAIYAASKGVSIVKRLSTLAGSAMFGMSMLFILLMLSAPLFTDAPLLPLPTEPIAYLPTFDVNFFLSLSILVFAVGGCEKMSPYVNKTENPAKDFPRGMIALTLMVMVTAILGTISLGRMFDSNNLPPDLLTNGAYYAFARLGKFYGLGNLFVILYAVIVMITQFSVMILSIDAPLRILLDHADRNFIPAKLLEKNANGSYRNGQRLVFLVVAILIVIPAFGISNVDALVRWLIRLNAVCMPLRYLWVFVAYIALKKAGDKYPASYRFVRNQNLGIFFGVWCFAFTAFACCTGIYSPDPFQLTLNILTPFVLVGLGLILPYLAQKEKMQP